MFTERIVLTPRCAAYWRVLALLAVAGFHTWPAAVKLGDHPASAIEQGAAIRMLSHYHLAVASMLCAIVGIQLAAIT